MIIEQDGTLLNSLQRAGQHKKRQVEMNMYEKENWSIK